MKLILEINESKAPFILELLKNFSFVKVQHITEEKAEQITSIRESINELNLIKEGKLAGIPAKDILSEL